MSLIISGASGQFGRRVAQFLLDTTRPTSSSSPATRTRVRDLDAEVRHGDFDDPATLEAAFAGATKLLLVSLPMIGARVPQHKAAIEAAKRAGVEQIAYTSIVNPGPRTPPPSRPSTARPRRRSSPPASPTRSCATTSTPTCSRSSAQAAIASGRLVTNAGAAARATSRARTAPRSPPRSWRSDGHENQAYDVTGPEALNADDLAQLYSELGGTPIEVVHVDDAAYATGLVEHAGMPPRMAEIYATFGAATRNGVLDVTTDVVER